MNLGLHDLRYSDAQILHRDITDTNIVWEIRDGKPYFILIDFDFAIVVDKFGRPEDEPSSMHRTGTLPFVSINILDDLENALLAQSQGRPRPSPVRHILRFDYESLLWVALWCAFTMEDKVNKAPESRAATIIKRWEGNSIDTIRSSKVCLVSRTEDMFKFPFSPRFSPWKRWFSAWMALLRKGQSLYAEYLEEFSDAVEGGSPLPEQFDWETLGGCFTKDAILEKITPHDMEDRLS